MRAEIVLATLLVLAPFARAQDDPGEKGPYAVERERISLDFWSPSMEVRVPEGADGPRPVVLLVHGWGMMSSDYEWVADHLASRGFAVASFDMWNPLLLGPDLWASEAKRALDRLTTSVEDPSSPLAGKIDLSRIGVIGHSLGGATAIKLADIDPRVKSAVALAPGTDWFNWWSLQSSAERATAPLLVVTGEHDFVTPTDMKLLDSKPKDGASRLLVEITGGNHFDFGRLMLPFFWWSDRDAARTTSARYFTAWFEKHLAGKDDHEGWTDGRTAAKDVNEGRLSRSASKLSEEEGIPLDLAKNKAVGGSEPVAVVAARAAVERTARTPGVIGALAVERGGEDRAEER